MPLDESAEQGDDHQLPATQTLIVFSTQNAGRTLGSQPRVPLATPMEPPIARIMVPGG
jgi:hypothetical protein